MLPTVFYVLLCVIVYHCSCINYFQSSEHQFQLHEIGTTEVDRMEIDRVAIFREMNFHFTVLKKNYIFLSMAIRYQGPRSDLGVSQFRWARLQASSYRKSSS